MQAEGLHGLSAPDAARCLIRALGMDPVLHRQDSLLHYLWAQGLGGRIVRVGLEEVRQFELPTLLQLRDERWVVLHGRHDSAWLIEDASGRRLRAMEGSELSGMVVERLPRLASKGSLWHRLAQLVGSHRRVFAQIVVVSAVIQGLALISPLLTRVVMDKALPQASTSLLVLAVSGVFLATLSATALGMVRDWTSIYVETRMDAVARGGLLDHMLRLPFCHLLGRTSGELLQAFTGIASAKDLLSQRLFSVVMDAITACGYLAILLTLWPLGAGLTLLASLALALLGLAGAVLQAQYQHQVVPLQIEERTLFAEMLRGIGTVKSAGAEKTILGRWSTKYLRTQRLGLLRDRSGLLNEIGSDGTRQVLTVLLFVEGGRRMLAGDLSLGTFIAFQQMSGMVMSAFHGVAGLASSFYVMRPQMEKTHEILSIEADVPSGGFIPPENMDLDAEDLWFRYGSDDAWVLKGMTLHAEAGSRHWLRWASGAGKSTCLRIMAGLLEPERGKIRIGGRSPKEIQDQIVYMPQGCQLYGASILENLQILSGRASLERIMAAAETSGLSRLISNLPMAYETLLSQGGMNVSGGQRQLVLLTAAMATERRLLLLDESFSNLDWLSRSQILQGDWFKGKTVIYASHDAGLPKDKLHA